MKITQFASAGAGLASLWRRFRHMREKNEAINRGMWKYCGYFVDAVVNAVHRVQF